MSKNLRLSCWKILNQVRNVFVIWKREKHESILNKVKTGKRELPQDYYYMQRYVQVMFQN